jgi:hypothetical protein
MTDQPSRPPAARPLALTADPRLDSFLTKGWVGFGPALAAVEPNRAARWFAQRIGDPDAAETIEALLEGIAPGAPAEDRLESLLALAEIAEEVEDDLLADTLWEGALRAARATGDPDALMEVTGRLAAIAERLGDPLVAAEYYIDFLNWRRKPGHSSDPESVEQAFDEVVRLAEVDGEPKESALWAYRQVRYTKLLEADDERAIEGDWEPDPSPYQSWG